MGPADILVVTAVKEEWDAVLDAGGGRDAWRTETASTGLTVALRDFDAEGAPSLWR